jgi:hypothetical protein
LWWDLCSVRLIECYSDYQIKKYEIIGAHDTYDGQERSREGFGGEAWGKYSFRKAKALMEGKNWNLLTGSGFGFNWVDLDQDRVTWRAVVNEVMTRRFAWYENFWLGADMSAAPEALCSMQSVSQYQGCVRLS